MPNSGGYCASTADGAEHSIDNTSVGLSIAANINARRVPALPISHPPSRFASGVVLSSPPDPAVGQVEMTFAMSNCERATRRAAATAVPTNRNFR